MSDMHAITARSSSGVQKERLPLLILIENGIQFAVAKDNPSAHEPMRTMPRNFLKSFEQLFADKIRAEFSDQLVIVDR